MYGSRANGTENQASDYDIAAFGPNEKTVRDVRVVGGEFLDVFQYPESVLQNPSEQYLRLRGSVVICQHDHGADKFLHELDAIFEAGPKLLPNDEILARKTWAWKMALRTERNDIEGNYRRVWLLTALLEDYFHIRGAWFEGPKKSLQCLREYDSKTHKAYEAALIPDASNEVIRELVQRVVGDRPDA